MYAQFIDSDGKVVRVVVPERGSVTRTFSVTMFLLLWLITTLQNVAQY
jgi:hypothetical protein